MADCPVCKAAIDCTGFLYTVDKAVDLIIAGRIKDKVAIDDFADMKEEMQRLFNEWSDKHIEF